MFVLKAYASDMTWAEIGLALLVSSIMCFVMWTFRKNIVRAINELCEEIFDGPSLLPLGVTAMVILYAVLLSGSPTVNFTLVAGAFMVQLLNLRTQANFYQGCVATLLLALLFQVVAIVVYASMSAMIAVTAANYASLILLSKRFLSEKNIGTNRVYAILSYAVFSTLIALHPYSLTHILVDVMMVVRDLDAIGWADLFSAAHSVMATLFALALILSFFIGGKKQVKNRPSAVFSLISTCYLLLSKWNIVTALLFAVIITYLVYEAKYFTLEDLIDMDPVPEQLERSVIDEFSATVRTTNDLFVLEEYLFRHPQSFYGWHIYIHLARSMMDPERYAHVVRIAQRQLGGGLSEEDILLPEPTWVQQD